MRNYNISANLVRITEQLYDKATSAVQMNVSIGEWFTTTNSRIKAKISSVTHPLQHFSRTNVSIGEWFRTTVGLRQGYLLSPTLFNIFLERIMSDALEQHDGKVSIGDRNITSLRFADYIDALAGEEQELKALVGSLDKT